MVDEYVLKDVCKVVMKGVDEKLDTISETQKDILKIIQSNGANKLPKWIWGVIIGIATFNLTFMGIILRIVNGN